MNLISHFFTGWVLTLPATLERRDRGLVVFASIAPDLDGVGLIGDIVQGRFASFDLYWKYHHLIGHNIFFAVLATLACMLFARRRLLVGGLALLAIHLHFLADVAGSAGPDGSHWEVPYLLPFTNSWQWAVSWQWALVSWQNTVFTMGLLALTLFFAWSRGLSPVGLFSARADQAFVATLRARFGPPPPGHPSPSGSELKKSE